MNRPGDPGYRAACLIVIACSVLFLAVLVVAIGIKLVG